MNRFTKRGFSLLLALALCISLLSGLSFVSSAATVEYVYGSYEDFTNVIYNWGMRGATATFLSPNAEDYYEAKGTSYEELAALAGSTDDDATDSALYAELKTLMTEAMTEIDYDDARGLLAFTDCEMRGQTISCFYSAGPIGPEWDGGNTWNREHIWPQSKINDNADEDIMMLRPANSKLNSGRGNKPYGDSTGYYVPNGNFGDAGYDIRGDVARTLLYGYIRWDNTEYMWGTNGVIESVEVLLAWMAADPVDTWEMGRNDAIESINGCRNVFVDYPELAFELFEQESPEDMATPSTSVSYDVKAVSSNHAWGSVKIAGSVINAYPAIGYELAGYRVTKGTAEVTVQGNLLIVNASSDCEITVDFKARANSTVTFMANGELVSTMTAYTGDAITLPDGELAVLNGYEFTGWVAEEINNEVQDAPSVYPAGTKYVVNADCRLYALFTRTGEGTGEGAITNYVLHTGALTDGKYLITYNNFAMTTAKNNAKNKLYGTEVSPVGNIISNPSSDMLWNIKVSGETASIYNESVNYVLGSASNNTNLTFPTQEESWNLENGDGVYGFTNPKVTTRALAYNSGSNYFGSYATKDYDKYLTLYKETSVVNYYTTGAEAQDAVAEVWKDDVLAGAYADLETAMAAADGGTVVLVSDAEAGNVIVKPGTALDLNGYTLTADLLVAMKGATVCDSGSGLLKIAKDSLALDRNNSSGVIALWNGEDGYIFTYVSFQQLTQGAGEGAAQYIFLPSFSNAQAAALLADGGADNGVQIKVGLTWADGQCQQFYTYEDAFVEQVFASNGGLAFSLTVTGISGISDMVANPIVVTSSGAEATTFGTALTAN